MASAKEIWEAGRKALGLNVSLDAAPAPVVVAPDPVVDGGEFNPPAFTFDRPVYRVHFKNGLSGEYQGATLAANFPFDVREVLRVESVD